MKYIKHKENPTSFGKGHTPWNKGLKGIHLSIGSEFKKGIRCSTDTEFKKGQKPWNKGLPHMQNEKHPGWKGNQVGYEALHFWIKKGLAKPLGCNHCGKVKPLDLANKSHEYKRELSDWLWLCRSCHQKYDNTRKKQWETRKENKWQSGF